MLRQRAQKQLHRLCKGVFREKTSDLGRRASGQPRFGAEGLGFKGFKGFKGLKGFTGFKGLRVEGLGFRAHGT